MLKKGASALEVWAGGDGGLGPKGGAAGTPVEIKLDQPISRPDGMRSFGKSAVLIVEGGGGGKLEKVTFDGNNGKVELVKQGYPDGPVAVTVVGTMAYVCEDQLSAMMRRPGSSAPAAEPKPFKATAAEVGKP